MTNTNLPEKLFLEDLDVQGKRVLVRVDFNVPLSNKDSTIEITDDRRIRESLPTIHYLVKNNARVILMSHLGRPKGKRLAESSLSPVAEKLGELLNKPVAFANDCIGKEVEKKVSALENGQILLLENLRFHPGEEKNDPEFSAQIAKLGDLYINDAFGTAHRAHASTEGVTHVISLCAAGYLLRKEIDYLGKALANPGRPFVAIIGGAKISSKIIVLEKLLDRVDSLLIGGGMAYTFFKAMGREIGNSLLEGDKQNEALRILQAAGQKDGVELLLPVDCVVAEGPGGEKKQIVSTEAIPSELEGLDIGPETSQIYCDRVLNAKTVVWNGPMGMFEESAFAEGTNAVARALVETTAKGATTIIGGGDSALAIQQAGLDKKVSHVSTGGGASLEFLEGKILPGLAALTDK